MTKLSNKNILTAPLQRKSKLTEYVFKTERLEIEINKNYDIIIMELILWMSILIWMKKI